MQVEFIRSSLLLLLFHVIWWWWWWCSYIVLKVKGLRWLHKLQQKPCMNLSGSWQSFSLLLHLKVQETTLQWKLKSRGEKVPRLSLVFISFILCKLLEIFPSRLNKPVSLRTKKLFEKPKQEEHPEIAVECPPPQGYGRSKLTSRHKKANHEMIHKVASLSINSDSSQESQNLWN